MLLINTDFITFNVIVKYKCKVNTLYVDLTKISDVNDTYSFIRKNYKYNY